MTAQITSAQLLERYGLDYFKNASTFGALTDDALHYLLDKGDLLQMEPGDELFRIGDAGDCFYVILDGCIGFHKPCQRKQTHIRDYEFGTEVGFVAMIGLHSRVGDAAATKPTLVLKVSCHLFSELQQDLPNDFGVLLLNLSREMSRRLRDADNRLAEAE